MDVIDAAWIRSRLTNRHGELKALADAVGLTPDKITKILKGERQINSHEAPRIAAFLSRRPIGFAEPASPYEGQAVPVTPGSDMARLIHALCPNLPRPEAYRVRESAPGSGLLAGDLLVVELGLTAGSGDLVVVTIADTRHDTQVTLIRRYWPPLLVPVSAADPYPAFAAETDQAAAVVASVKAMARGGAAG